MININITKQDFIKEFPYGLFNIDYKRLEYLFYNEPIFLPNSKIKHKPTRKSKNRYYHNTYNECIAIQGVLDESIMMYNRNIVPISIKTIEYNNSNGFNKYIRYLGYSIDDEHIGMNMYPINDTKISKGYKIIKDYLYLNPILENNKDFIKYFKENCKDLFEVEFDFS